MQVITREDALRRGLTRYFTGKPCKRGHVSERQTSDYRCIACERDYHRGWYTAEYGRLRYKKNIERERKYYRDNKDHFVRRAIEYAMLKRRAMPAWLTAEQRREIEALYEEARRLTNETGIPHHVDHRVPICCTDRETGEQIACGLHVPWNLEPVLGVENLIKGPRVDRDALDQEIANPHANSRIA